MKKYTLIHNTPSIFVVMSILFKNADVFCMKMILLVQKKIAPFYFVEFKFNSNFVNIVHQILNKHWDNIRFFQILHSFEVVGIFLTKSGISFSLALCFYLMT